MSVPSLSTTADTGMQPIMLPSGPVYYRQGGSGSPLLLLHGWGGSSRYWRATIEHLSGVSRMYAPDLPGYGVSPPLIDAASSERLAALVIEFADALGLERFDLNGHSFSAGVAVNVAARWPHRVRRLVLTCASTYRDERERRVVHQVHRVMALWMALRRPWMERRQFIYRNVGRRFFYRMPTDDEVLRESFADFLLMDRRTALEGAAGAANPTFNALLREVPAPTLLIGARQDAIMPPAGTPLIAQLIPDCQLVWIERCGHLPMIERPEVYHRVLRAFLATE